MAIFRCNKCAHLEERPDGQLGETVACPKCGNMAPVYGTQFFVAKLLDKYFAGQREISRLKTLIAGVAEEVPVAATASSTLNEIDFFNTDSLASDAQHGPIYDWFKRKQITVQANMRGVDTTGFFDEVAVNIGNNLGLLSEVMERVRWAQQKDYSSTTISLDKNQRRMFRQSRRFASSCTIFRSSPNASTIARKTICFLFCKQHRQFAIFLTANGWNGMR
jgi:hypothetical protein